MRTRCPNCGTTLSLDALIAHDGAREALGIAFKLSGSLGNALVRYLGLFRPETRELTMDRVAKLLAELLPDVQSQRIERGGQVFSAPPECWAWAIDQALSARETGRLATPLKGHGWLYQVMTQYQPQAAAGVLAPVPAQAPRLPSRQQSQTSAALAALEDRANG
ncbi:hypothetical protein [Pseudomonas mosselii]|uniref:DUF2752 domain-containing protein n=1 Tax=Pseudomonas mosselii TaxID=78327 RepID=A0A290GXU1_9PSED|nr:hypothetical protein [Pseudomonas mosselii]ATB63761.1 hypothetical protein CLJ08_03640 [Pseudomonas mosselii]MBA6065967.1 hypothetical protein [Pseudomonas mosselii]ODB37730.1 hypothetical protein A9L43_22440 [Pseudomonas mosselii]